MISFLIITQLFATVPYNYIIKEKNILPKPLFISKDSILGIRYNYFAEFAQIAEFLTHLQCTDSSDTNFGGVIEAEAGELGDVIQTDNTLEAIWVWTRYGQLTGDTTKYKKNINMAWIYSDSFPAWEEEGLPYQYYRVHNCAWGILASKIYCAVYDNSREQYGRTCAEYIIAHPLDIFSANPVLRILNAEVEGWAAGNLYNYGVALGEQAWQDTAIAYGDRLLEWVRVNPQSRLSDEFWAMSSGTIVWGICNSVFQEDTNYGKIWIDSFGSYVDTFQPWYNRANDGFDWDNAWNVGFCNAHYAMFKISHTEKYKDNHKFLTNLLLSYDTDDDGGIPATTQDPDTEDMTWISSYLTLMGINNLIDSVPQIDCGILCFISPKNDYVLGDTIPVRIKISNFGLSDIDSINIKISGAIQDSTIDSINFLDTKIVEFNDFIPQSTGNFSIFAVAQCVGDNNIENDTLTINFNVYGIEESSTPSICNLIIYPNPFTTKATILLPKDVSDINIYDIGGRLVKIFKPSPKIIITKIDLSPGIYFIQIKTKLTTITKKLIIL